MEIAESIVDFVKTFDDEFETAYENLSDEAKDSFLEGIKAKVGMEPLERPAAETDPA